MNPKFVFNKTLQPKSLNINLNQNASLDICDEIDSLLSEVENQEEIKVLGISKNTTKNADINNGEHQKNVSFSIDENLSSGKNIDNISNIKNAVENPFASNIEKYNIIKPVDYPFKEKNIIDHPSKDKAEKLINLKNHLNPLLEEYNKKWEPDTSLGFKSKLDSPFKERIQKYESKLDNVKEINLNAEPSVVQSKPVNNFFDFKLPKPNIMPDFTKLLPSFTASVQNNNNIEKIKTLLEDISKEINIKNKNNLEKETKIVELTEKINHYKKLYEDIRENNIKMLNLTITKQILASKINSIQENLITYQNEIDNYKKLIDKIVTEKESDMFKIKDVNKKLIIEKEKIISDNLQINKNFQKEIDDLNIAIQIKVNEITSLKEQSSNYQSEYEKLKILLGEHEQEIGNKNNIIKDNEETIKSLKYKIEDFTNINENEKNILNNKLSEIEQIININKSLKMEIADLEKYKKLNDDLTSTINKNEMAKKIVDDENSVLLEENVHLKNKIEKLNASNCNLEFKTNNIASFYKNKNKHIKTKLNKIQKMVKEINIGQVITTFKKNNFIDMLSEYYQKIYETELKKYKKEKNELINRISELMEENKRIRNGVDKIMPTKFIEPSDSDLWNVFN